MSLVTGAVGAGFRYISGDAVGAAVTDVPGSRSLTLEELYALATDPQTVRLEGKKRRAS